MSRYNQYKTEFFARCPSNGVRIKYTLSILSKRTIMVENILAAVESMTAGPVYHEALADRLEAEFPGTDQRLEAHHHGVDIATTRGLPMA